MNKSVVFTDKKDPVLTSYLKEISKYKIYSAKDINKLIVKAQQNDEKARELVIKSNLRFVVSLAKKWQGRGVPLMDLISEGNIGLTHSVDLFDVTRGTPFISYAVYWIKQYMYQAIYWTGKEIRLPVSQQVKVIQLLKAETEFAKTHFRKPSVRELAEMTGLEEKDINYLSQFSNKLISVDDYLGGDSDNNQVCDVIPSEEPLLDEGVNKEFLYNELEKILSCLTIREHDVVCLLFGIGREPMDSKSIGAMFGVGTERVRQIKEGALTKLRNRFGDKLKSLIR